MANLAGLERCVICMHVQWQAKVYMSVHFSMTLVFSQRPRFPEFRRFWWQEQQDDNRVAMPFLPMCSLSPKSQFMKSCGFSHEQHFWCWIVRQKPFIQRHHILLRQPGDYPPGKCTVGRSTVLRSHHCAVVPSRLPSCSQILCPIPCLSPPLCLLRVLAYVPWLCSCPDACEWVVGHYFLLHFISAWHVKDECVPLAMEVQ